MQIKVIAVEQPQSVEKGKSKWQQMDVSYKDLEKNKVSGKTLISFKYPQVWDFFRKVEAGTIVNVSIVKEGDFWQWTDVETVIGGGGAGPDPVEPEKANPSKATPAPYKSNYETTEERAWRQTLIVRQSSVSAAVAALVTHKSAIATDSVIAFATEIENWVNRKPTVAEAFINMTNDIPE